MNERKAVKVVYPDFSKTFDNVFLTGKIKEWTLDEWIVSWVGNWLNDWSWGVIMSTTEFSWRPVASDVSQGSILNSVLLNKLISDLIEQIKYLLRKSADDARLGGVADIPVCRAGSEGSWLERSTKKNFFKFNKGKWRVLHLGRNYIIHLYRLGYDLVKNSSAEKHVVWRWFLISTSLWFYDSGSVIVMG